ncbi:hypothetical protein [Marinomonas atlantica]|uniref:hypothetical protein n=1 Tax=Marinomonas atlantica TaxID=1806668 RepID=UPI0008295DD2|nr:hypothetical protein [Marinomonas atlantica]
MYGRIKNGVVVDVSTDPNTQFHPILAAEFVEIPDKVKAGWTFDGTEYAPPVVPDPEPIEPEQVKRAIISPVDFKFLFTLTERVKIKELRATDLALDDFYSMLDDPRLTVIDLSNSRMIEGVNYAVNALAVAEVVADPEQRISEILGGGDAVTNA